ncbi:superoxide dismutase family protein [Jannaschia sp. Os4]|uniref:superoxide dismutase family protein n=1 Tax=Jannaschia sp. Os4 TaxID=2807617 RepID=UPI00193A6514|nr:superoxide dismutase family protein [Jannaschia sp. Os4]MBM2577041.1 superoxide dismutase family protein [Jannaschia sp. Os4]
MRLAPFAAAVLLAAPAFADGHVIENLSGTLLDREGNNIGSVAVLQTASGIVRLTVAGIDMEPGAYGIHFHETGVCEGDFSSAGGHIGEGDSNHGLVAGGPHAGDNPNGFVPEGATALNYESFNERISFEQLLDADGAALIVHSGPDDYVSQPSGDAGDRIACSVLEND